ncbi:bifunctional DNA-formamidopyrimidine glycosylase/DNA-(apurinic or apyrimidinic site) lyase [Parashewanella spongiae]|uniref:Formamidopyrimidine-DNA glycosylase n=1 Tax=Parashewanella spongiae TaxID=342950 RepID=A0A3A6T772_9GAMM|nr:bifunctional DNA-formamidopyrimidine glycosylase/DNA-(apurinic or apyrimidinic site) lyase [Parashewanella spongiae]MCL1079600.1 bifunctional DNA-formamidopyrimidine glycosylase/DNA-(apurinic or apyrimidinic site) lyase [Parashewanella spongiae]RJY07343.1 bifunctional DNA-formamidopyrimidine glycosylase/DNA-(apurinic or apyrimidinic site) lyase [Parashewanella spongiae]
MPELPEVEVTRQGIAPHLINQTPVELIIRNRSLRWPIPDVAQNIIGQKIRAVYRRAKYLLVETQAGTTIIHLGMSGSLRVLPVNTPIEKHDHVDLVLDNKKLLRFNDPRRFGAWLWYELPMENHPLFSKLGPEPLTDSFNVEQFSTALIGKTKAIKLCLMDNHMVVGVGNIYANEALFKAKINPSAAAGQVDHARLGELVSAVKDILAKAITQGGTTLKDFTNAEGKPGYFAQKLHVYGRGNQTCDVCGHLLSEIKLGQRTTVFCGICQPIK